jgi:hypothetical protein
MLVNIHTMLGDPRALDMETEGFLNAEKTHVYMSATGWRSVEGAVRGGRHLEVKDAPSREASAGVIVYGTSSGRDAGNGETEIALHFNEMSEELRNEIIQYSLMRQREIIRSSGSSGAGSDWTVRASSGSSGRRGDRRGNVLEGGEVGSIVQGRPPRSSSAGRSAPPGELPLLRRAPGGRVLRRSSSGGGPTPIPSSGGS